MLLTIRAASVVVICLALTQTAGRPNRNPVYARNLKRGGVVGAAEADARVGQAVWPHLSFRRPRPQR